MSNRLYKPSNGVEGACFIDNWCSNCQRDKVLNGQYEYSDATPSMYCDIFNRSFWNEPLPEWVYDDNGEPMCTEFLPVEKA